MKELIQQTEELFGFSLRGKRADNVKFILRMLIIEKFPEMRPCEISNAFEVHPSCVNYYRSSIINYEQWKSKRFLAVKQSFEEKDTSFYLDQKQAAKKEKMTKDSIKQYSEIKKKKQSLKISHPKITFFSILDVLEKDRSHRLWNKSVSQWNQIDLEEFNRLKTA